MVNKKLKPVEVRKFYSYMMIMMLSILLILIAQMDTSSIKDLFIQVLGLIIIVGLQFLIVKGIVDSAYNNY